MTKTQSWREWDEHALFTRLGAAPFPDLSEITTDVYVEDAR